MFFFFSILPKTKDLGFHWIDCLTMNAHVYVTYQEFAIFLIPLFHWGRTYHIQTENGDIYQLNSEKGKQLEKGDVSITWSDLETMKKETRVCPHCGMPIENDSYSFCPHCGKPLY